MVITNKNTNGVRTIPLAEREVMQELTPADPNYGKIVVGTNGTYVGEVLLAKDVDVVANAGAIVALDGRLDTAESEINTLQSALVDVNLTRADKYLSAQNITSMVYVSGDLVKIQYNTASDSDYEVLAYVSGNLSTIDHYVGTVLKGTTTLTYTGGKLTSAIFVSV